MYRGILDELSKSHAMEILENLSSSKRFTDICNELQLNPNIVNMRLKGLKKEKLVKQKESKYIISKKGEKALKVAKKLENL